MNERTMGDKEWSPANIFELFGDTIARRILVVARRGAMSADELAERIDASPPTIYRRVNALIDYGFLTENQQFDDDGNHYKTFETSVQRLTIEVTKSGYLIDTQVERNIGDQFQRVWSDLDQPPSDRSFAVEAEAEDTEDTEDDPHRG